VIPTYERPHALARLLGTLSNAHYPGDARPDLIISVDGNPDPEVVRVAESFDWKGTKEIIRHDDWLGLRAHIIWCGSLSSKYGSVLILEEDLAVSPYFYEFGRAALSYYDDNDNSDSIASISLYSFRMNEYASLPFVPIDDGWDVYFLQTCSSRGQIWTETQWKQFLMWYEQHQTGPFGGNDLVPEEVKQWPPSSWKKYFNWYMIQNNLYSVVPRSSLTTNFGDKGTHTTAQSTLVQSPLLLKERDWRFTPLNGSMAVYDGYFEPVLTHMLGNVGTIPTVSITVDLYGKKDLCKVEQDYVITTGGTEENIASFGIDMYPPITNVIYNIEGNAIHLVRREEALENRRNDMTLLRRELSYLSGRRKIRIAADALRERANIWKGSP